MRAKLFILTVLLTFPLLNGCQTTPLLGGLDAQGKKVYLTDEKDIQKSIDTFAKNQDLVSGEGKINYLLARVEKSKVTFIRNGSNYTSSEAAEFLRWKLNRPRWRPLVKTANDFVTIITKGSVQSGDAYQVVFPDQTHRNLEAIMQNELDFLETHLKS